MYSFLRVVARSRAREERKQQANAAGEMNRSRYSAARKRQKMRDVAEGKVNRARINIPAWMEDDRARRRERNGWTARKKEIEHAEKARIANERTKETGGKESWYRAMLSGRFYSREAFAAAGRFRTINSVLWPAKSYDGNRVNHAGTRSRVRHPP